MKCNNKNHSIFNESTEIIGNPTPNRRRQNL